jgi:hypothetical protein
VRNVHLIASGTTKGNPPILQVDSTGSYGRGVGFYLSQKFVESLRTFFSLLESSVELVLVASANVDRLYQLGLI